MKCVRKVNAENPEYTYENSVFQFDPRNIFTQEITGINIPIFFPIQKEVFEVINYQPIFFKPKKRCKDYEYYIQLKTKINPVFFNTDGIVERSQAGIVRDSNPNIYRLVVSKFLEHVSIRNHQIPGLQNTTRTKMVQGRDYIKANRSIYGSDDC